MPTRKPKRTNWKQEARRLEAISLRRARQIMELLKRAQAAEAQVGQLVGDIQAVSQDYTDAKKALEAAERHNAELLKEREARPPEIVLNCDRCNRSMLGKTISYRCVECANPLDKPPSWLRRNWVELTVTVGVLGATVVLVWWAWRA